MNPKWKISKESKEFIENLRVYLFSTGKNHDEIAEITEELEVHLAEAEKKGKPIEKIIGSSPKEYMEMLSKEMPTDYKTWIKYGLLFIFISLSFSFFPEMLKGSSSFSLFKILGDVAITTCFLGMLSVGFKYISISNKKVQIIVLTLIPVLLLGMSLGLIYLDRTTESPMIHIGIMGSISIGIITVIFLVVLSVWLKSWVLILVMALLILPEYFLSFTPLSTEMQSMLGWFIFIAGVVVYLWILNRKEETEVR